MSDLLPWTSVCEQERSITVDVPLCAFRYERGRLVPLTISTGTLNGSSGRTDPSEQ